MTNEVIVFPDATAILVELLNDALPTVGETAAAHGRVPQSRPAEFVRVIRTGGPRANLVVDAATMTVESWAADEETAMELAQLVRGVLHAAAGTTVGGVVIYRVQEFAGPGNQPDPVSNQARAVQTFAVELRGNAIPTS